MELSFFSVAMLMLATAVYIALGIGTASLFDSLKMTHRHDNNYAPYLLIVTIWWVFLFCRGVLTGDFGSDE